MTRYAAIAGVALALCSAPAASAGEISYVSGGIGVAEQESLRAREKDYNLKLVFTLVEGNYLADVGVEVKDPAGKVVIGHVANGPFFLAKLPAGQYVVTASYEGSAITRKVRVAPAALHTEYLRWASKPGSDFAVSRRRD